MLFSASRDVEKSIFYAVSSTIMENLKVSEDAQTASLAHDKLHVEFQAPVGKKTLFDHDLHTLSREYEKSVVHNQ